MRTTTTTTAVLATTTGALALSLLLAGCSGTSSDEGGDPSSAPEAAASQDATTEQGAGGLSGELVALASCDDATALLGDLVVDLTLQEEQSSTTEAASTCAWSSDPADIANLRVLALQVQREELDADQRAAQADAAAQQIGGSVVDDERSDEFDGRSITGTADAATFTVSIGSVVTPTGVVVMTATGASGAPLTPEESLDAAFLFVE